MTGTPGADTLIGGPADNTLDGGAGDDVLIGGAGADLLLGGTGSDTASYRTTAQAVTVTLDSVADDGAAGEQDLVGPDASIENVEGGSGDDWLIGDDAANRLAGGAGDDILTRAGGPDVLAGGAGGDISDYADRAQPLAVDLDDGAIADNGEAGEGDTLASDIEDARGGAGSDTLIGAGSDNILAGEAGADHLVGGAGDDELFGGPGADTLNTRDGAEDGASSGAGADGVTGDALDFVDTDCESVDLGLVAQIPAPVPPRLAAHALPPAADRTAPTGHLTLARARLGQVPRKGLRATVRCSEACR